MTHRALSDSKLKAWMTVGEPLAKADGDGLTFTLSSKGAAAWVLRYRHGGRRRELTLGRYPDLTLKQARLAAAEARLSVARGSDVAAEKQRRRADAKTAWTVREVVRDFEKKVLPGFAAGTQTNMRAYIDRDILTRFGAWLASDITPQDVHQWLEGIAQSRSFQAAANARKIAIAVGDYALARHVAITNPFRAVSMGTVAKKPKVRARVKLDEEQLRTFLQATNRMLEHERLALRLLLLTGCRSSELFKAEWSEIDLRTGLWRLPSAKLKTGARMQSEYFEIQLPSVGVEMFERLHNLSGTSRWVLPGPSADKPLSYDTHVLRLRALLATLADVPTITHHDLRSTARSYWSELGVRTEVAERMLNHSLGGLLQIYDRSDFSRERRVALERWAAKLSTIEHDDEANVVSIQRSRA